MTVHSERRHVPYTAQQMFDLVADVGAYPTFIPWIKGARIRKKTQTEEGGETFEADLVVAFSVFRESYTSRVVTDPPQNGEPGKIAVEAISGPFTKLVTHYSFHAVGDECEMRFDVDFTFRNRLLQRAAGAAFDLAMRKIAGAFEDRAKELYR